MPLRIGFDLDGVIADMDRELQRQCEQLFGASYRASEQPAPDAVDAVDDGEPDAADVAKIFAPSLKLTAKQERALWRHVATIENFWETLEETEPGLTLRLASIANENGWEVIFLTKRPSTAGSTSQVQSQRWLRARGFALPSVFVVQGSRGLIAKALDLDVVVDDRPENCLDVVVDSSARAILVWRDQKGIPASARRLGIGVVKTVGECLDILAQADTPEPERGLMARVMKALGLNETADV